MTVSMPHLAPLFAALGYPESLVLMRAAGSPTTSSTSSSSSPASSPASSSPSPPSSSADGMDRSTKPAQANVEAEMRTLAADVAALGARAVATTDTIKVALRTEIDELVVSNSKKVVELQTQAQALTRAWGKTTLWDTACSRFAVVGQKDENGYNKLGWVDQLEADASTANAAADKLSRQNGDWIASIATVEAEVQALEATATTLQAPPKAAKGVVALRAHGGIIASLSALEQNLARQITLLTSLRDSGVQLSGEMDAHLTKMNDALDAATRAKAESMELFKVFLDIVTSVDPRGSAEAYLRQSVADTVRSALHDAGVTPEAFTDKVLEGSAPAVAEVLRPRLIKAFTAGLPRILSTGDIIGELNGG